MRKSAHLHLVNNITVKYCLTNFFQYKNQFFLKKKRLFGFFTPEKALFTLFRGTFSIHLFTVNPDFAYFKLIIQHRKVSTIARFDSAEFT